MVPTIMDKRRRDLGRFCISGVFSNSHRSNSSSHPTNNVEHMYPEFFRGLNFVWGGGKGELQENFEKDALF